LEDNESLEETVFSAICLGFGVSQAFSDINIGILLGFSKYSSEGICFGKSVGIGVLLVKSFGLINSFW